MNSTQKQPKIEHEQFKTGQGYGSSEPGADALEKQSTRQFGDNPLPESGGDWAQADEVQPLEDPEANEPSASLAHQSAKIEKKNDALHH